MPPSVLALCAIPATPAVTYLLQRSADGVKTLLRQEGEQTLPVSLDDLQTHLQRQREQLDALADLLAQTVTR
ncbi:MAG: hypothetical protein GAK43_01047 [Stenotrophomonas maltophilia]|nr:MAG: hypothetical protein GAK43_01047 [Stenotrophomonas maltophilia]